MLLIEQRAVVAHQRHLAVVEIRQRQRAEVEVPRVRIARRVLAQRKRLPLGLDHAVSGQSGATMWGRRGCRQRRRPRPRCGSGAGSTFPGRAASRAGGILAVVAVAEARFRCGFAGARSSMRRWNCASRCRARSWMSWISGLSTSRSVTPGSLARICASSSR